MDQSRKIEHLRCDGHSGWPSPLITAETLRKLESLRIESKAEYVRQATLLERLKSLGKELGMEGLAQAIPTAAPDNGLSSLLEQLTVAEQRLVTLEKEYGPLNTEVTKCKAMVEDLHTKIKNRVDGIMLGLDARVLSLSNSLDNLEKEVVGKRTDDDDGKRSDSSANRHSGQKCGECNHESEDGIHGIVVTTGNCSQRDTDCHP